MPVLKPGFRVLSRQQVFNGDGTLSHVEVIVGTVAETTEEQASSRPLVALGSLRFVAPTLADVSFLSPGTVFDVSLSARS